MWSPPREASLSSGSALPGRFAAGVERTHRYAVRLPLDHVQQREERSGGRLHVGSGAVGLRRTGHMQAIRLHCPHCLSAPTNPAS